MKKLDVERLRLRYYAVREPAQLEPTCNNQINYAPWHVGPWDLLAQLDLNRKDTRMDTRKCQVTAAVVTYTYTLQLYSIYTIYMVHSFVQLYIHVRLSETRLCSKEFLLCVFAISLLFLCELWTLCRGNAAFCSCQAVDSCLKQIGPLGAARSALAYCTGRGVTPPAILYPTLHLPP